MLNSTHTSPTPNCPPTAGQSSPDSRCTIDTPLIALVDDDLSFLRAIGRLLRSRGYQVAAFGCAVDFLAALPALSPRCLVCDVHMPEMTGLELHERLIAQGFDAPVLFLTAFETPQTRARAERPGGLGLLLKPFDEKVLLYRLQQALG